MQRMLDGMRWPFIMAGDKNNTAEIVPAERDGASTR